MWNLFLILFFCLLTVRCGWVSSVSWSVYQWQVHQHTRLLFLPVPSWNDCWCQWQDMHWCVLYWTDFILVCGHRMYWCFCSVSAWFNMWMKCTMCPAASRPAYRAVLPHPWRWAVWDSYLREASCGCLLLLCGCSLGSWMWRMSREGHSRICPALPSWSRLLS